MQKMDAYIQTLVEKADASGGVGSAVQLLMVELEKLEKLRNELDYRIEQMAYAKNILANMLLGRRSTAIADNLDDPEFRSATITHYNKSKRVNYTAEVLARSKQILLKENRPLTRGELLERIKESDFIIMAADPAKFIGRTLWESKDFYHIKNEGYWLTERKDREH